MVISRRLASSPPRRSYLHCQWVSESDVLADHQGKARLQRWRKVWDGLQQEFMSDAVKEAEWEPFPSEWVEVDRIIAKRVLDPREALSMGMEPNQVEYLVKWKSMTYDGVSWELAGDIAEDAKIAEFERVNRRPTNPLHLKPLPSGRTPRSDWKKQEASYEYPGGNRLRPYQLEGLNWLSFCWHKGTNSILADEMGLGKTVQTVALIHYLHQEQGIWGPFLVVAPLSTLGHWQREFEAWTTLNTVVYHGNAQARQKILEYEWWFDDAAGGAGGGKKGARLHKVNVVLCTPEMVNLPAGPGEPSLAQTHWRCLVVDEAHRLKNSDSKFNRELEAFRYDHMLLLTGTPLQNNPQELFSLIHFLEPRIFPSHEQWLSDFGDLSNKTQVEKLTRTLRPFFLRRMKGDVEKSVPPKEETVVQVELTTVQKQWYRAIYERNLTFLSSAAGNSHAPSLMNIVMELRKCCNHPFLIEGAEQHILASAQLTDSLVYAAGKMVLLHKLLPKLRRGGHKVLIFSQMVRVLNLLEDYLRWMAYPYERIDGCIKGNDRQAAIDRFSKPDSDRFVFLLCTRAGGVGINLTAADTVIIYDSDWNPQNDLQAQARCHRIGQTRPVKVYRLITRNSYEEVMFEKASLKLGLDQAVLSGIENNDKRKLTGKEIAALLKHGAYGALESSSDADASKFCEDDIDTILERSSKVTTHTNVAEANSSFSQAHFAVQVGGTDVSVDDPEFWSKVGFVNRSATEKAKDSLGERKRKQVSRLGMGQDDDEDEGLSGASDAERLVAALLKYGIHRTPQLPSLTRMPHITVPDCRALCAGFIRLCTQQVGPHSEQWPVAQLAAAAAAAAEDGGAAAVPKELKTPRMRERIGNRAREDLVRLHQLHALYVRIDAACNGGGGGGSADWHRTLLDAKPPQPPKPAQAAKAEEAEEASTARQLLQRALSALPSLVLDGKVPLPCDAWEATHDNRLLLGLALHGWGQYDAIRRHAFLWAGAPPLVRGAADAPGGAGEGGAAAELDPVAAAVAAMEGAPPPLPQGAIVEGWPETKLIERRLKALIRRVPGAVPPAAPQEPKEGGGGRDDAGNRDGGGGVDGEGGGNAGGEGGGKKRRKEVAAESDSDDSDFEKKGPLKKRLLGGGGGGGKVDKMEKPKLLMGGKGDKPGGGGEGGGAAGRAAASEREAARRELQDALLAFGMPEGESECEKLRAAGGATLLRLSLAEVQKGAERFRKEWELDKGSRDEETSQTAKTRLNRLEILKLLRRFLKLGANRPAIGNGGGSAKGDGDPPPWYALAEHDLALVRGVLSHGFGNWKQILDDTSLMPAAAKSTPVTKDLKKFFFKRLKLVCDATKAKLPPSSKPGGTSSSGPGGGGKAKGALSVMAQIEATAAKAKAEAEARKKAQAEAEAKAKAEAEAAAAAEKAAKAKAKAEARAAAKAAAAGGAVTSSGAPVAPAGAPSAASASASAAPPAAASSGSGGSAAPPVKVVSLADLKGGLASDSDDDVPIARLPIG